MSWRDWPRAPAPGTPLCPAAEVGRWRSLDVGGFGILLVGGTPVRAFVNACPHQYLPLDHKGGGILSEDGSRLICSSHQACFEAATGALLSGPADEGLEAIPLVLDGDGMLRIGDAA